MSRLEEEARAGNAGSPAGQIPRRDVIVLVELGCLPFARSRE